MTFYSVPLSAMSMAQHPFSIPQTAAAAPPPISSIKIPTYYPNQLIGYEVIRSTPLISYGYMPITQVVGEHVLPFTCVQAKGDYTFMKFPVKLLMNQNKEILYQFGSKIHSLPSKYCDNQWIVYASNLAPSGQCTEWQNKISQCNLTARGILTPVPTHLPPPIVLQSIEVSYPNQPFLTQNAADLHGFNTSMTTGNFAPDQPDQKEAASDMWSLPPATFPTATAASKLHAKKDPFTVSIEVDSKMHDENHPKILKPSAIDVTALNELAGVSESVAKFALGTPT